MQLVFRAAAGGRLDREWNALVEAHPCGWFWSRTEWIDFQLTKWKFSAETPESVIDLSHAVVDGNGKILAASPMILVDGVAGMGDWPAPMPLMTFTGDPFFQAPRVTEKIMEAAESIAVYGPKTFRFGIWPGSMLTYAGPNDVVQKFVTAMQMNGARDRSWETRVIDVSRDYAELHSECRKSYRQILRDAASRASAGELVVGADVTGCLMRKFQQMHARTSGRLTRPMRTWRMMEQWIRDRHATLFGLRERGVGWIGFCYIIHYKQWAYYASAASVKPNAMHVLQGAVMKAIREIAGVSHYEIGWQGQATDDKGKNIEFFRRGFGGIQVPMWVFEQRAAYRGTPRVM